uniref:Uncharacterized protein n=1 Tax=Strongyloides venezuelensis TaxID=75913 RepID=A0A0K0G5C9_STRVS
MFPCIKMIYKFEEGNGYLKNKKYRRPKSILDNNELGKDIRNNPYTNVKELIKDQNISKSIILFTQRR